MTADVRLYPAWREALRQLREAGRIVPGELITREELEGIFGLKQPATIAEYEQHRLKFLQQFTDLREALLEDEQAMLRPVQGMGWEIVPPAEQTGRAMDDRLRSIHRELHKLGSELVNIRADQLTEAERAANTDARAKAGQLAAMLGRKRLVQGAINVPKLEQTP